jgi:hypothetical protein
MQTLHAAAAAVQAAHSQLQANPPPAQLTQFLGSITPLQGVRVSDSSHHTGPLQHPQQIQNQPTARMSGDQAAPVSPKLLPQENDGHGHAVFAAVSAPASDQILIPLMCRVASVIEYLKTHVGSAETHINSPVATAIARLENAMVYTSPFLHDPN